MRVLKMGIGVLALTSFAMGCTGGSSSGSSSGTSGNNNNTSSSSSTGGGSSMGGGSSGIIGSSGGGNSSRMQGSSGGGGGSSSGSQVSSNPIVERMTCLPDGAASSSSQGGNSSSATVVSSSAGGASSVGGSSSGGGACVDDALPAHYSPAAAHVVMLTNNAASLTAMVSCPENEDWYKVAVPAGAGIKVDMAFMDATSDLDLYIYAEAEPTVSLDSSTGTTDMEEVSIPVVDGAQNLLVRVRNYSRSRNDYTINFTVTPGGICAMDSAGDNSTEAMAEVLYSTTSNTRWILCPPAADYFSFTAPSAGTARVKAVFGTPGQLSFILFTAGMEASPVATSAAVSDGAEATFTATADTDYFIKVTAPNGATYTAATYKLQASGPAFCFEDANEPNNDEAGATTLVDTDYGTLCSGDVDVFTFTTTAGNARVRIFPTNPNSVDAAIQTTGGTVVTSTRMDVTDGFELSFAATAGTAYFVRLSNANGVEQSSYDIEFFAPPPANDTCATAIALTPTATGITVDGTTIGADATVALQNRQCTGYATPAGDVFYTVTIGPNQLLTVRLDSTDSTDLAVYLIDDCATRCCWAGADRASGGSQEVLQYRNITGAAQNLFLAVDGWTASSVDGFSMEVLLQ